MAAAAILKGMTAHFLIKYPVQQGDTVLGRVITAPRPSEGAAQNGPTVKAVATVCVAVVSVLSFVVLVGTLFGLG